MIEIIINSTTLLLDPKIKIRMEWNSPLFAEDVFEGNKIYWFDIPFNPINNKAFKHMNIPGMSGKFQTYPDTLVRLLGVIEMKGTIIVNKIINNYRAAFTTNDLSQYKETLLTDLDWGSSINLGTTTQDVLDDMEAKALLDYDDTNYNYPMIHNPDFYSGSNITYRNFLNYYDLFLKEYTENTIIPGFYSKPEDFPFNVRNEYSVAPQFYLRWMFEQLSTIIDVTFTGEILTDDDFKQILVYNDFSLDENEPEYYVKANDGDRDVIDTDVLKFTTIDKGTKTTYDGKEWTIDYDGFHSFYLRVRCTTATPGTVTLKISIYNVTSATEMASEEIPAAQTTSEEILFIYYDEQFVPVDIGEVIQMRITADVSWVIEDMECSITNVSQTNLNRYANVIDPSNHVPNMKLNNFLYDLKLMIGLTYFIDSTSGSAQISFLKDILTSDYLDITDKIKKGQEIDVPESKNYNIDFEWDDSDASLAENFLSISEFINLGTFDKVSSATQPVDPAEIFKSKINNQYMRTQYTDVLEKRWLFYTDIVQTFNIDNSADETEPIAIKANPFTMYSGPFIINDNMRDSQIGIFPQIKKKGNSVLYGTKSRDIKDKLRLMHWIGLVNYDTDLFPGLEYPFATSFNYDMNVVKQKNITLFLEGEDGLYINFLQAWYEFISKTEEVTFNAGVNFGVSDLMKLIEIIVKPQSGATVDNIRWLMIESIKYLPKQMTAEISMQGLESIEIKGIKEAFD